MSETITYTLTRPFQFTASRHVDSLTLATSLKVRDFRRLDTAEGGIAYNAQIVSLLSGEPMELIDAMDAADLQGAVRALTPFFMRLHGIGGA